MVQRSSQKAVTKHLDATGCLYAAWEAKPRWKTKLLTNECRRSDQTLTGPPFLGGRAACVASWFPFRGAWGNEAVITNSWRTGLIKMHRPTSPGVGAATPRQKQFSVEHGLESGRCCSGVQLLMEAQTGSGASFQPGWMGTVGAEKEPSIHRTQGVLHQNKPAFARQPAMVTGRDSRNSVYFRWCLNANKGIPEIAASDNLFPIHRMAAKERKRPQLFSWRGFTFPNDGNPVVHVEEILQISEKIPVKVCSRFWASSFVLREQSPSDYCYFESKWKSCFLPC